MNKFSLFEIERKKTQHENTSCDAFQPGAVEIKSMISSDDILAQLERNLALGRYENISYESVGLPRAAEGRLPVCENSLRK